MATTDQRAGFRLPWTSEERSSSDPQPSDDAMEAEGLTEVELAEAVEPTGHSDEHVEPIAQAPIEATATASAPAALRASNRFIADLTKAMQAAAESARSETLTQLQADAKVFIEELHGRSAGQTSELRKRADDDVAAVRDWSKAEVARVREKTEQRIATRKSELEHHLELHAGAIEREIERIHAQIGRFESDMERFFERLRAEQDPGRIAALAANLPEPPPFDMPAVDLDAIVDGSDWSAPAVATAAAVPVADAGDVGTPAEPVGLADLGVAEAEAAAAAGEAEVIEPNGFAAFDGDAINARLANLIPDRAIDQGSVSAMSTQVIVVGLVSVSSIASFKRHVARLDGVRSVGVSSGPDGEFVFNVAHDPEVQLQDAITALPGFHARVTSSGENVFNLSARDPEAES